MAFALLLCGAGLFASTAHERSAAAGPNTQGPNAPLAVSPIANVTRIDGGLRARLRASASRGITWRTGRGSERALLRDVGVVLRFATPPSSARIAELEARGVRFTSHAPTISGAYTAKVDEHGLDVLESASDVVRVSGDALVHAPRPGEGMVGEGSALTGLREMGALGAIQALRAKDGKELDGAGTVIGDLDSDVFVFHPALFRADAGYHAFVDVNGDGKLTLDTDGIDLDGDGAISPNEVLHRIPQGELDFYTGKTVTWRDVNPARDFVYLDANGNGKRDYGAKFPEDTPGYGEPMFILDDANADGVLSVSEKLVQLGTSKIRAVRSDKDYVRGDKKQALVKYEPVKASGADWYAAFTQAGHGTLSANVLVGGQARGQELRGVAPGAEVVVATGSMDDTVASMQWLVDQGANVLLTEFAPYVNVSLDGSSELEAFLDAAHAKGILTSSPAGNLGRSNRHITLNLQPGSNIVPLEIGTSFKGARLIMASFHQKANGRKLTVRVRHSGGAWNTIPADDPNGTPIGSTMQGAANTKTTSRGTHETHAYVASMDGLPETSWDLDLVLDAGAPVTVEGYVMDDVSSWAGGVAFKDGDGAMSICNPATADKAIRVGAYALADNKVSSARRGEIADYSSRGPLLRGGNGIDLGAPTDALAGSTPLEDGEMSWVSYGGTSGAGPHVAGAIALLRQAMPNASADELKTKLLDSAKRDALVDKAGPTAFGRGRLDVAKALGVTTPDGDAPTIKAVVENDNTSAATVRLEATAADNTLRVRWDLDYDGKPDTDWEPLAPRSFAGTGEGLKWVRAEVLDAQGRVASTTAKLTVGPQAPTGAPISESSDEGCNMHGHKNGTSPAALAGLIAALALVTRRRR